MKQLYLFEPEKIAIPESEAFKQFKKYHKQNPEVYEKFVIRALQAIVEGHKKLGAQKIIEQIRWEDKVYIKKYGMKGYTTRFKLSNNYMPFYSRLFTLEFPHYEHFFEKKSSIADGITLEQFKQ